MTKIKSKAIMAGSGSGSGSGTAGGTTGGTSGPSVVGSTESLTAYRNLTRDSADRYHSVITETSSVSVGAGGELATDENVTYTNDVSGELSRDDRSYVKAWKQQTGTPKFWSEAIEFIPHFLKLTALEPCQNTRSSVEKLCHPRLFC